MLTDAPAARYPKNASTVLVWGCSTPYLAMLGLPLVDEDALRQGGHVYVVRLTSDATPSGTILSDDDEIVL